MDTRKNQALDALPMGSDERPQELIPVGIETITALFQAVDVLKKRVDALEQASKQNNQEAKQLGGLKQDPDSSTSTPAEDKQQPDMASGPAKVKTKLPTNSQLQLYVEFRSRSWQEDGKISDWITIDPDTAKETTRAAERRPYQYDIDEEDRFIFRVFKSAELYEKLLQLCPPGQDGQVFLSQSQLVFKDVFNLLHCKDDLRAFKIKLEEHRNKTKSGNQSDPTTLSSDGIEELAGYSSSKIDKMLEEIDIFEELYKLEGHMSHIKSAGERLQMLVERRKIDCGSVKGLFHMDQLVVFRELRDEWVVAKVTSVTANDDYNLRSEIQLVVECKAIDFDGKNFRYHQYRKKIDKFNGTRKITELEIYPLNYHPKWNELISKSIESGQKWYDLHKKFVEPTQYEVSDEARRNGTVMELDKARHRQSRIAVMHFSSYCETFQEDRDIDETGKGSQLDSRVIVDPSRYPDRRLFFTADNTSPFPNDSTDFEGLPQENPLVLCPESVLIHSLSDNQWYLVAMARLEQPVWAPKAWQRFVKTNQGGVGKSIDRIKHLAEAHRQAKCAVQDDEDSKNNFRGKGKGLTFLLHGPPGVGKTMLAECLSEDCERPLYRINLGQLVTGEDNWEAKIDEIFRQAHEWDAILLVDEAEVILAERTQESMQQSAWVAVFLRKIEYFEGILFLTTNLIHMIDPAFISRVNLGFRIPPLDPNTRLDIWKQGLSKTEGDELEKSLQEWKKHDLNGRQIRNIIYSSRLLTTDSSSTQEAKKNLEDSIEDVMKFKQMIQDEQEKEKASQWRS